jgi:hypothetical protein
VGRLIYGPKSHALYAWMGDGLRRVDWSAKKLVLVAKLPKRLQGVMSLGAENSTRLTFDEATLCVTVSEGDPHMPESDGKIHYKEVSLIYDLRKRTVKTASCPKPKTAPKATVPPPIQVVSDKKRCGVIAKGKFLPIERRPEIGDCWAQLGALSPSGRYLEVHANQGGGAAMEILTAVRLMNLKTGRFVDLNGLDLDGLDAEGDTTRIDATVYTPRRWSYGRDVFLVGPLMIDLEGRSPAALKAGEHAAFLR